MQQANINAQMQSIATSYAAINTTQRLQNGLLSSLLSASVTTSLQPLGSIETYDPLVPSNSNSALRGVQVYPASQPPAVVPANGAGLYLAVANCRMANLDPVLE